MSTSQILVYGLFDPKTEELRYIGLSTQGLVRPKQHTSDYYLERDGDSEKAKWIKSLLTEGLEPEIRVLQECASVFEAGRVERELISYHRAKGTPLTNIAGGGLWGPYGVKRSEDTVRKSAEARRGVKRTEEQIERMRRGQALTPRTPEQIEHMRKLGRAWKGRVRSAETKAKMAEVKRGKPRSPETIAKISATLRNIKPSEASIAALRDAAKASRGKPKSEETKAKMKGAQQARRDRDRQAESQIEVDKSINELPNSPNLQ